MISEAVFEARFAQAEQLCRMGADIRISGQHAVISGVRNLQGAEVFGKDLRGTAALLVAALAAEGQSLVHGQEFLERGYEKIEEVFSALGGEIRLTETETEKGPILVKLTGSSIEKDLKIKIQNEEKKNVNKEIAEKIREKINA